jgi:molybdopterin converting factor small subunit
MPLVEAKYFAALRESAGVASEIVVTEAATAFDLYGELALRYGFSLNPDQVKCAVNGDWSDLDVGLSEGDVIVFIPPVAGG